MRIYNVDSSEQFNYKRNDYKKSEAWQKNAKKRKNIYVIGISLGAIACLCLIYEPGRTPIGEIFLAIGIGGFFGWIPGLSYSKISAEKNMEVGAIERRSGDIVTIDGNIIRYLYNENVGDSNKTGYKIRLEKVQSITCNRDRRLITISANKIISIAYSVRKGKEISEYKTKQHIIKIPMYFENNEELLKDLEESVAKIQDGFKIAYI